MTEQTTTLTPCPFCPYLLPEGEGHLIGTDYYNRPEVVAGIACCGDCAMYLKAAPDEIPGLLALVGQEARV